MSTNPRLAAVREEIGIRRALLVEAGLLPDPELGWDAMDLVATSIDTDASKTAAAVAGLSLMFPLLRPGELEGRVGAAEWRVEGARWLVAAAECRMLRNLTSSSGRSLGGVPRHVRRRRLGPR